MDWLKAKYYERKIEKILHKKGIYHISFKYFLLVARGFTMYYVKPNTTNRVTVKYKYGYAVYMPYESKTFENIKDAYNYFK